jgi:hypothetical protein
MSPLNVYKSINQNKKLMTILTDHQIPVLNRGKFIQLGDNDITLQAKVHPKEITPTRSSIQLDVILSSQSLLGDRALVESFGEFGENLDEAIDKSFSSFCLASLHPILSVFVSRDFESEQSQWDNWSNHNQSWEICSGPIIPKMSPTFDLEQVINGNEFLAFIHDLRDAYFREATFKLHWLRFYRGLIQGIVRSREVLLDGEHWKLGEDIFDRWEWHTKADFFSLRQFMIAVPLQHKKQWWQFWR